MHKVTLSLSFYSEEKAIELYKQLKAKCKSQYQISHLE